MRFEARFRGAAVRHAEAVLDALRKLMEQVGVRADRIVYCKDGKRRGFHEHTEFTFLGFTFRARGVRARLGARRWARAWWATRDGARVPGWERRRTRERSARFSFRRIGRRRSHPRRRRTSRFGWSFGRCGLAGCAARVRPVYRWSRSAPRTRHARRRPWRCTCRGGLPLQWVCASASALRTFAGLLWFSDGVSLSAQRRTPRAATVIWVCR